MDYEEKTLLLYELMDNLLEKTASSEYYRANKAKIKAKQRIYRSQNQAKIKKQQKIYNRKVSFGTKRKRKRLRLGDTYVFIAQ
jgi:hypothetical protein